MIRILFLIEKLSGGGAEKVLCNLVNNMDYSKFDVTVMTFFPYDSAQYLNREVHYQSLYSSDNSFNRYRFRIESALNLVHFLHINKSYDIEVAYLESVSTKIISYSNNRKSKKIAWVHCDLKQAVSDYTSYAKKTFLWYKKFDSIVCVSNTVKKSFDEIFSNAFESVVIHNTVISNDIINHSKMAVSQQVEKKGLTIALVGRMYPQKNIWRLLKTHNRLINEGIENYLWLIGDGEERTQLETYVKNNKLNQSVRFFGYLDNPYPYMKAADLLVCSSNYEGFSTFITEGLILGKPIVTTDCSGMHELLGESEYGLITNNDDESFYYGLKRMVTDSHLRNHYGSLSKLRGRKFYTDKLVKDTENFFVSFLR